MRSNLGSITRFCVRQGKDIDFMVQSGPMMTNREQRVNVGPSLSTEGNDRDLQALTDFATSWHLRLPWHMLIHRTIVDRSTHVKF